MLLEVSVHEALGGGNHVVLGLELGVADILVELVDLGVLGGDGLLELVELDLELLVLDVLHEDGLFELNFQFLLEDGPVARQMCITNTHLAGKFSARCVLVIHIWRKFARQMCINKNNTHLASRLPPDVYY